MKYSVSKQSQSRVSLAIELSPEEWERHRGEAEQELAKSMRAEGFRQGKAPVELVRSQIGEEGILTETARRAVQASYREVAEKEELDPIGEPELQVKKLAPGNLFEFQITVSVLPSLALPDYRRIASEVERHSVELEDKEVDEALEWLRKSRPRTTSIRGRQAEGEEAPELNDEFAKALGAFQGLEELKASIKEGLLEEKKQREKQRARQEMLEKIAEKVPGEMPEQLVEREQEEMLANLKGGVRQQLGVSFEEYLQKVGKTEEGLREEFNKEARKRVKTSLVLREIAKQEGVVPSPEEVEEGMQQVLSQYASPKDAEKNIDPEQLRAYTKGALENEKTLQLLEQYVQIRNN